MIRKYVSTGSLRTKIVAALMVVLIPLIALLILYNIYTMNVLRQQTAQSNKNTLSLYTEYLDNSLSKVEAFLVNIVATNINYNIVRRPNGDLKTYLASFELVAQFEQGLAVNQEVDMFFVFSNTTDTKRVLYKSKAGYAFSMKEKDLIETAIQGMVDSGENYAALKWFPMEIGGKNYLMRVLGNGGTLIGAVIDMNHLEFPLSKIAQAKDYTMLYNNAQGQPLIKTQFIQDNQIGVKPTRKTYEMSGYPNRYMVISERLYSGDLYMTILIPDTSILKGLNAIQLILLVVSLMTILIIPMAMLFIRKWVISPLGHIVDSLNEIKQGHWDTRMPVEEVADEFKLVNETFNTMMSEIKSLKIVAYEEKIEKQKARLQYLQFQIKPHFFLNALKNLYGMAQNQQFAAIQEMILGLSNHFRYMFNDNFTLVKLKEELDYVENYIGMQNLCMAMPPEYKQDVDERLLILDIPPITLQTFVENSLKHGIHPERILKITIKGVILKTEDGDFADILVMDNGSGFSSEELEKLKNSQEQSSSSDHIGLSNVRQRLKLIYGDGAQIFFMNAPGGGAVSEILIPIEHGFGERQER